MTIEEKLDNVIQELDNYRKKELNLIIKQPQLDEYKDIDQFNFLDKVKIIEGFYKGVDGIVVKEGQEIPVCLDWDGKETKRTVVSYGILIKNHEDMDITVEIDTKYLKSNK